MAIIYGAALSGCSTSRDHIVEKACPAISNSMEGLLNDQYHKLALVDAGLSSSEADATLSRFYEIVGSDGKISKEQAFVDCAAAIQNDEKVISKLKEEGHRRQASERASNGRREVADCLSNAQASLDNKVSSDVCHVGEGLAEKQRAVETAFAFALSSGMTLSELQGLLRDGALKTNASGAPPVCAPEMYKGSAGLTSVNKKNIDEINSFHTRYRALMAQSDRSIQSASEKVAKLLGACTS